MCATDENAREHRMHNALTIQYSRRAVATECKNSQTAGCSKIERVSTNSFSQYTLCMMHYTTHVHIRSLKHPFSPQFTRLICVVTRCTLQLITSTLSHIHVRIIIRIHPRIYGNSFTHTRAVCGRDEMILMYLEILRAILMCI